VSARWEAEIRIRRNGRLVKRESALGDDPAFALASVHNDLELWAEDQIRDTETEGDTP
jgi:hypothetical protein